MSSKYTDIMETCFVSAGLLFGFQSVPDQSKPNTSIQVAQDGKTTILKDGAPSEITVNAQSSQLANTIIVVSTYAAIGLGIIGMRVIELRKSWRQSDSETAQGKLEICEGKLNEMIAAMESQAKSMQLIQKSNDALNNMVQEQIETIAKLSAPVTPAAPPEPDPQPG